MKKQRWKKIGALLAAMVMAAAVTVTMAGCGGGEAPAPEQTDSETQAVENNGTAPSVAVINVDTKGVVPKEHLVVETEYGEVNLTGIDLEKPMIALTFDDGPGAGTGKILRVLQENNAKATFFELGSNVENNPEMTKQLADAGMQVASHTYSHPDLAELSVEDMKEQYSKTENAVKAAAGTTITAVRAPYGSYDDEVKANTQYPIILWSVDTLDWSSRDTNAICDSVYSAGVGDGDILLFHDIYETTADAIEILVPYLQDQGFQLVTVDQLFAAKEIKLEKGGVYSQA